MFRGLYLASKVEVAKEAGYEWMYEDLKNNGPNNIYKLAKTRQRRDQDIDRMIFVKASDGFGKGKSMSKNTPGKDEKISEGTTDGICRFKEGLRHSTQGPNLVLHKKDRNS